MNQTKRSKASAEMSLKIEIPQPELMRPKITIFGAGGAGGNAINNMIRASLEGVEFVAANTDAQALENSLAKFRIQLGIKTTKGLGAGSFPERGKAAAEENIEEIERYLEGNNMVFIAAGMGGGTGTGAAPVIAKLAHERDILTVGVVTKPFHFEGKYRMETAEKGIEELKKYVDTLIIIPNQNLFRIANEHTTFESAFKMADDVLHAGVRGITDLITMPGLVNLDFADIRTIMTNMGKAMMGTGEAAGENRAIAACEAAISNPLLDDISIKGAKGVLVNMTGGPDMTLFEADMAVNAIKKEVDANANIIFGSAFNENMKGKIRISVVATGIDIEEFKRDSFRAQENYEPSRFKIAPKETPIIIKEESVSPSKESAVQEPVKERISPQTGKDFFDPGIATMPEDNEFEELTDSSFGTKKNYSIEANPDYAHSDEAIAKNNNIKARKDSENLSQISFFNDRVEETFSKLDQEEEEEEGGDHRAAAIQHKKASRKERSTTPSKKKDHSGFSLFSFMNASKIKDEEVQQEVEEEVKKTHVKSKAKAHQEHEVTEVTKSSAEKKRDQFFGATIFDDNDNSSKHSTKIDDDILNVPAFFRRKKQ